MAMNKKEQKAFEEFQLENEALKRQITGRSHTETPEPFVWDSKSWSAQEQKVVEGWSFNAVLSYLSPYRVYRIWSLGHTHYSNPELTHGTQGSGILYRTKVEALIAARAKLQKQFNSVMAQINQEIGSL